MTETQTPLRTMLKNFGPATTRCCATCRHFAARDGYEEGICMAGSARPVAPGYLAWPSTLTHDGETCDGWASGIIQRRYGDKQTRGASR